MNDDLYIVSVVETSEGYLPLIVATHEIAGQALAELLEKLENVYSQEEWEFDWDEMAEIGEAYAKYINAPQAIVDASRVREHDSHA